ncbi:MAG TPA: hypothetical protein VFI34_09540 [Candidatus Limnocylindrales bacterium]|nr:hypothetical protein [Candidatus Limnocylindrales bacterium]
MSQLGDLGILIAIAVVAAVVGVGFGIVVLAPRISRLADRMERDEEQRDGHD